MEAILGRRGAPQLRLSLGRGEAAACGQRAYDARLASVACGSQRLCSQALARGTSALPSAELENVAARVPADAVGGVGTLLGAGDELEQGLRRPTDPGPNAAMSAGHREVRRLHALARGAELPRPNLSPRVQVFDQPGLCGQPAVARVPIGGDSLPAPAAGRRPAKPERPAQSSAKLRKSPRRGRSPAAYAATDSQTSPTQPEAAS